jgi:hypothetical protein
MRQPHLSTHLRLTSIYFAFTRLREWVLVKGCRRGGCKVSSMQKVVLFYYQDLRKSQPGVDAALSSRDFVRGVGGTIMSKPPRKSRESEKAAT